MAEPFRPPRPHPLARTALAAALLLVLPVAGAELVVRLSSAVAWPAHGRVLDALPELLCLSLALDLLWRALPRVSGRAAAWLRRRGALLAAGARLAVALVVFLLPLNLMVSRWQGTHPASFLSLGGQLPLTDSLSLLSSALDLGDRGSLNDWGARRPLASWMTAGLWTLAGGNLHRLLALQTLAVSAAMLAAVASLPRRTGFFPSLLFAVLLCLAYAYTCGAVMSEATGMLLGCLGFACIARATRRAASWRWPAGLFLTALALFARAGAFFVLPALLGARLAARGAPGRWRVAAISLAALTAAALLNRVTYTASEPPGGGAKQMGDFPYYLYNFSLGQTLPWDHVRSALPELAAPGLTERDRSAIILRAARANIAADPAGFTARTLRNLMSRWPDLFHHTVLFSTPFPKPVLVPFFLAGLLAACRRRPHGRLAAWLAAALAGSFLSLPFLTMDFSRIFTATAPLLLGIHALGAALLLDVAAAAAGRIAGQGVAQPAPRTGSGVRIPLPAALTATLVPLLLIPSLQLLHARLFPRPSGEPAPLVVRRDDDFRLLVVTDDAPAGPGRIRTRSLRAPFYPAEIQQLTPGSYLVVRWQPGPDGGSAVYAVNTPWPEGAESVRLRRGRHLQGFLYEAALVTESP